MRPQSLNRRRSDRLARANAIIQAAEAESRDFSDAEQTEITEIRGAVEALDRDIATATWFAEAERRQAGTPASGDGRWDDLVRGYSLRRAVAQFLPAAMAQGIDFGREREVMVELERRGYRTAEGGGILVPLEVLRVERRGVERRDITTTTPAAGPGSHLIATDHLAGDYIDLLRAALVIPRVGARVLSGLTGNVSIPGAKSGAASGWFAEGSPITASDPAFRSVPMTPRHVGSLVYWSINMTLQSSPDIEVLMRQDLAAGLAEAIDKAALAGAGGVEPLGILGQAGVGIVLHTGGPSWERTLEMINTVETANGVMTGWVSSPSYVKAARSVEKFPSTNGQELMESPTMLAGYPLAASNNCPHDGGAGTNEQTLIAGGWPDLLLGYWGALTLLANPYGSPQYERGGMALRATLSADVAVRHAELFCKSTDITG